MSLSFAHLWMQREHSDVDVVLVVPPHCHAGSSYGSYSREKQVLTTLPAHSALLSNSDVYRARLLRWQDDRDYRRATKHARRSSTGARAELELELHDASEQEAALAVLKSLYAVKPLPELLGELSQEQQLQAALLADKWQVPHVSSAAAKQLADAVKADDALAEEVEQRVLQDPALPDCLQPLLKNVLLSLLGDLEAAWADGKLREKLLRLPLHAMELLLSCDELKVASEDTVLYTAESYICYLSTYLPNRSEQWLQQMMARAKQQLAPLIRCPHLSPFWLSGTVNSVDAHAMLLAELRPQIRRLLLLRDAQADYNVADADLQEGGRLSGAPPSWALGCRVSKPVASVQLVWQLDMSALRDAARSSVTEQRHITLRSPRSTPPLGGIDFDVSAQCVRGEGGVQVGLYCQAVHLWTDMVCMFSHTIKVEGIGAKRSATTRPMRYAWGWPDFFGVKMAEGWDEVAWAGKGLPASGQLTIKLTVSGVPHARSTAGA